MQKVCLLLACLALANPATAKIRAGPDTAKVRIQLGIRIPLRDGVQLNALAYLPKGDVSKEPCIFNLTPYGAQTYHQWGTYFAARGFRFVAVDVRGRGDSLPVFRPLIS